jgi:hypothetical protein
MFVLQSFDINSISFDRNFPCFIDSDIDYVNSIVQINLNYIKTSYKPEH